jgi:hypothetical protein
VTEGDGVSVAVLSATADRVSDSPAFNVRSRPGVLTMTAPSLTLTQVVPSSSTRTVQRVGCSAVTCPALVVTL